jgi:hypothetical protein
MITFQRSDQAQIVNAIADVGKQVTDHRPRLTAWSKYPVWFLQETFEFADLTLPVVDGNLFPVIRDKLRLVVKRIDVRHSTSHVQEDDAFGFRLEVRLLGRQRILAFAPRLGTQFVGQHCVKRDRARAPRGSLQHLPTIGCIGRMYHPFFIPR